MTLIQCPNAKKPGDFDLALWINVVKNARRKAVELAVLQMIVEIPKQITLANLAMRDEFFAACTNELMAVGGVLGLVRESQANKWGWRVSYSSMGPWIASSWQELPERKELSKPQLKSCMQGRKYP
eukprot:1161034-Pelagomonas_calceolata.AAC.8